MLIEFDGIENSNSTESQLQTLRDIKNDMIGSVETKLGYFNKGLVETLMLMLQNKDTDC